LSAADLQLKGPQALYEDWERGQWSPFGIDLGPDRADWDGLSEEERSLILFALSSLMVAEERITTQFTGLVMAYDSEEEATFLATQQVDEARHMQHYARVQNEVIADPGAIVAHVARSRAQLSDAFNVIFDDKLVAAHLALVAEPRNRSAKVGFVTIYHVVIEGTLGLTSFHFITRLLNQRHLLPGFVEGYTKIHHDEQRHIAYGTWFCARRSAPNRGWRTTCVALCASCFPSSRRRSTRRERRTRRYSGRAPRRSVSLPSTGSRAA